MLTWNDSEFIERVEKEREYKQYIAEHIENVEKAYSRLILPLKGQYDNIVDEAIILCGQYIPLHDLSKLSKYEFDAYRKHFYPTDGEKENSSENDIAFEKAWEHHYLNNPHHPIFWTLGDKNENMPLNYIFEMLCDWSSVSNHFINKHGEDTSVVAWYDNKAVKEKKAFTERTRELVDFWVDEIFRKTGIKY